MVHWLSFKMQCINSSTHHVLGSTLHRLTVRECTVCPLKLPGLAAEPTAEPDK